MSFHCWHISSKNLGTYMYKHDPEQSSYLRSQNNPHDMIVEIPLMLLQD